MQWSRQVLLCIECRRVPEPVTCACSYTGVGPVHKDADLLRQPHYRVWPQQAHLPSGLWRDRLLLHRGEHMLSLFLKVNILIISCTKTHA